MTDDLLSMIKEGKTENVIPSKKIEEIAPAEKQEKITGEIIQTHNLTDQSFEFPLVPLSDWFHENASAMQSVRVPKTFVLHGVNPKKTIIVTVLENRVDKDSPDSDSREVMVIKKCLTKQVINLPPYSVDVFDHDILRIVYQCGNGISIKSYCLKNGLINIFCWEVDNELIPYARDRLKKGTKTVVVPLPDFDFITNKLKAPADLQKIHLLYKQVEKQTDSIKTNFEAIAWLNSRQEGVIDVNHLMQLDDTIIYIMNN